MSTPQGQGNEEEEEEEGDEDLDIDGAGFCAQKPSEFPIFIFRNYLLNKLLRSKRITVLS